MPWRISSAEAKATDHAWARTSIARRHDMTTRRRPDPRCPLRPQEPCTLCQPGAHGPHDCATVWLVMGDPELREDLRPHTRAAAEARRAQR
ncbi:DUF6767 domain-containing protein [Microbacterium sp. CIAB417]|uniref:DUF6767 domain-containing protein n=1 Tax=Microbacterium sp. CIAB417 TaxID=2860287 RepID=UPI0027E32F13|nr:DUF6767 domain-containing protein [Microbacterium sp. CIAB417]